MKRAVALGLIVAVGLTLLIGLSSTASAGESESYDQYLINALKSDNVGIRTSAAQLLGERKCREAIAPLEKMMKKDKSYAARIVAALSLHEMGDESVYLEIEKAARRDPNRTARQVLKGIVNSKKTEYITKL